MDRMKSPNSGEQGSVQVGETLRLGGVTVKELDMLLHEFTNLHFEGWGRSLTVWAESPEELSALQGVLVELRCSTLEESQESYAH